MLNVTSLTTIELVVFMESLPDKNLYVRKYGNFCPDFSNFACCQHITMIAAAH
jgi:hypothetical protein